MRLSLLASILVLVLAVSVFGGVNPGTIETSFGGMFHVSPEPWELTGNMYLVYYVSPALAFGPFWEVQKCGDEDDVWIGDTQGTFKNAWHYHIGVLGKMYLPVTMAGGKLMPYVVGGVGLATMPKPFSEWSEMFEEETEGKFGYFGEISFDYWIAESWTLWGGFRVAKVSGDADTYFDMYGRDLTDTRAQVLVGVSNFIMK
jgi:hypothetical protein